MNRAFFLAAVAALVGPFSAQAQPAQPAATRLTPVFPQENRAVIFVEGEAAVTTNFNREPTLNYSCSGSRTLQLNRTTALQGPFYAEYAFYVEVAGRYELWYGGTPPGPKEKVTPSYASPFRYVLDDGQPVEVYREATKVHSQYTPSYYWNLVSEVELAAGRHTLRFEVTEKRDYDGRFYFYLDSFFLARKERGEHVVGQPLPRLFPKDLGIRPGQDRPFRAVEDYEIAIRDNPKSAEAHVELALVYTLVGDYLGALKHVRLASALDPDNAELLVLQAKNLIWKGQVQEGLESYRKLLLQQPVRLDVWNEAGKVAAWTGRYDESISFYESGLRQASDSLDLVVNLGLALLWASRQREAEGRFAEARRIAGDDYDRLAALAGVYELNGVPERAAALYREVIRLFPDRLEPYLLLYETLRKSGRADEARDLRDKIASTFVASEELGRRLDVFYRRQELTEQRIAEYQSRLASRPDDLELRTVLAQALFWNGMRARAAAEYGNILANYGYRALAQMDQDAADLLRLAARAALQRNYLASLPERIAAGRRAIGEAMAQVKAASDAWEAFQKTVAAAREKGEAPPKPEGPDPQERQRAAEQSLAAETARARGLAGGHAELVDGFAREVKDLERIRGTEAGEEEVFFNIVRINRWDWDRKEFEAEMNDLAGRGQVLAHYVVGRVQQIGGDSAGAQRSYRSVGDAPLAPARYGQLETLLWEGRGAEAARLAASFGPEVPQAYPYVGDLLEIVARLQPQGEGGVADSAAADEALAALSELEPRAREGLREANEVVRELKGLLAKRLRRTIYFLEENTTALRRELGDLYLAEKDASGAIRQYRRVLGIDPWDTATLYRLGTVYELKGDWRQAMQSFERVYWNDPLYENAASLYNKLGRSHADSLELATRTFVDTSRMEFDADGVWKHHVSSATRLDFIYHTEAVRLYKPGGGETPSTYQVHELAVAAPLALSRPRLTLTPRVGVYFSHDLYDQAEALAVPADLTGLDFLGRFGVEPVAEVTADGAPLSWMLVTAGYRWGRHTETFSPERPSVYGHTAELGVTTTLAFLPGPALRDSSLRAYGKVQALSDDNLIYQASEELALVVLRVASPDTSLRVLATGYYEDALDGDPVGYYAPDSVLTVEGGLAGSTLLPVGSGNTLGILARIASGLVVENLRIPSDQILRWKVEGEANFELGLGEGSLTLGAQASRNFWHPRDDYWSMSLRLGFVARLPRLLAP